MADPISSTIDALKDKACDQATRDLRQVRGMSKLLAELLAEVYGGQWNPRVNHERGLVMIVRVIEGGAS